MTQPRTTPLTIASLLLGVGLGAFLDGIVLHQILQWHNMLSSVTPPTDLIAIKYNMIWDGMFHAFAWATTVTGIALLFRAGSISNVPWSGWLVLGHALSGWGLFNLIEGVVNHQLLAIHHVRPGPHQLAWDLGFLVIGGLGLIGLGHVITRRHRR